MKDFWAPLSGAITVLGIQALGLVVWHAQAEFPGSGWERFEALVSKYDGIIISIGTLLLVTGLAVFTTFLSNKNAARLEAANRENSDLRERANRRIATQLKLVEFRQAWINDLRDQLAAYYGKVAVAGPNFNGWDELAQIGNKILLLMNPEDKDYNALVGVLTRVTDAMHGQVGEAVAAHSEMRDIAQRILKREWNRLKDDLGSVDGIIL